MAGGWDQEVLLGLLGTVQTSAGLLGTGFDDAGLRALADALSPPISRTDPDDVPDAPSDAVSRRGDVWSLGGEHRAMCGDSTSPADLGALMAGGRASLVFTDPPYGVDYDGGTTVREKLAGDEVGTSIYGDFLAALPGAVDPRAPLYVFFAGSHALEVFSAVVSTGYQVRALMVWHKMKAHYGALSAQYKLKHEPFLYCHRRGQAPYWYGPTNEVTVWEVEQSHRNDWHPTQKPVALAERAMRNSSEPGDIVLDPFGGSGSTLIAAHSAGRVARLMEIEPRYVDVIVRRFAEHTGDDPVRGDGAAWSELTREGGA